MSRRLPWLLLKRADHSSLPLQPQQISPGLHRRTRLEMYMHFQLDRTLGHLLALKQIDQRTERQLAMDQEQKGHRTVTVDWRDQVICLALHPVYLVNRRPLLEVDQGVLKENGIGETIAMHPITRHNIRGTIRGKPNDLCGMQSLNRVLLCLMAKTHDAWLHLRDQHRNLIVVKVTPYRRCHNHHSLLMVLLGLQALPKPLDRLRSLLRSTLRVSH